MASKSEKRLIVNADDYGTNDKRNRGILQAAREGIVTSTSIIANLIEAGASVQNLKDGFGSRIGIHLNLTAGVPLAGRPRTLASPSGNFWDKKTVWRKALGGNFDLNEIEEEFTAQLDHLLRLGIKPDHIDGNNHIHVFPGITEKVAQLARALDIVSVRLPREPFFTWRQYVQQNAFKKSLFNRLSRSAASIFTRHGLYCQDNFAGIQFPVVAHLESLRSFMANLPEGTTELMCHPGYRDPKGSAFSGIQREQELSVLTNKILLDDLRRFKIRLVSYSDML